MRVASEKVASLADVFVNNRATIVGQKATDGKTARVATTVATEGQRSAQGHQGARGGHFSQWRGGSDGTRSPTKSGQVKCYACGGFGHMARDRVSGRGNARGGFRGGPRGGYRGHSVVAIRARVEVSTYICAPQLDHCPGRILVIWASSPMIVG